MSFGKQIFFVLIRPRSYYDVYMIVCLMTKWWVDCTKFCCCGLLLIISKLKLIAIIFLFLSSNFFSHLLIFILHDRVCAGCNTEIGHGRFLSCMNAVWHPECFCCHACNQPISDYEVLIILTLSITICLHELTICVLFFSFASLNVPCLVLHVR